MCRVLVWPALLLGLGLGGCRGGNAHHPADASLHDVALGDVPAPQDGAPGDSAAADAAVDGAPDAGGMSPAPPTGICLSKWCWAYPLPQGNALQAVWGTSASDVWVAGETAGALHYDGTTWTWYAASGRVIWGSGTNDVWIGGSGGIYHWNGTAMSHSDSGDITVLGGTGPTDVWAYSRPGAIMHWDGTTWSNEPLPAAGWRPIAFGGSTATWCISDQGGVAKWLGTQWGIAVASSSGMTEAVILDDTHFVAAPNRQWNGTSWTNGPFPTTDGVVWNAIAARSLDDVSIAGFLSGTLYRYHWNGTSWSTIAETGDTGVPEGLWIDPVDHTWEALGDAEVRVWSGTSSTAKTVGDNYVRAVWGTSESDIWTISTVQYATNRNRVLHWNGSAWQEIPFPYDATYEVRAIWESAPDDVWIAGGQPPMKEPDGATDDLFHWDGSTWSHIGPLAMEPPADVDGFTSIWGTAANNIYVISQTQVFHFDGTSWAGAGVSVPGAKQVFGTAANDVYITNGTTTLWHWDGTAWSSKSLPEAASYGLASSPTDLWLSGDSGTMHYDGQFFVTYSTGSVCMLLGTSNDVFALGEGVSYEWPSGSGSSMPTSGPGPTNPCGGGWRAPDGHLYVAGSGLLVH